MIGVLADDADHPVVSEFFELFKTPWEFYREDSSNDVLICCDARVPRNNSARLILIYGTGHGAFDAELQLEHRTRSRRDPVLCQLLWPGFQAGPEGKSPGKHTLAIHGACQTFTGAGRPLLAERANGDSVALAIDSNGQTFVRFGFDFLQEIRFLLTQGQPAAQAGIPALELHIDLLRRLITSCGIPLVEIPPVTAGYTFIACLTHDVDHVGIRNHKGDHTLFGFLYRASIGSLVHLCRGRMTVGQVLTNWAAILSLPFVHLGLARDFWYQFDRYVELEGGLGSTFYVIPHPDDPGQDGRGNRPARRAARYSASAIGDHLHGLLTAGREVGVHGIDAWRDRAKGSAELAEISGITGAKDLGIRMHWLYFDEHSPAVLEDAGFVYDSTSGYNEAVGYRAGTTQVFKPLGLKRMLELPMHIMDTALFYPDRLNLSPAAAEKVVANLLDNAEQFGGALTINWHDRSIAPERLWDGFYVGLLRTLRQRGAWFPTASQAVAWFQKRRSAVIESVSCEAGVVRIKASIKSDDGLPGLRIRVHRPSAPGTLECKPAAECVDVEFTHNIDTRVSI